MQKNKKLRRCDVQHWYKGRKRTPVVLTDTVDRKLDASFSRFRIISCVLLTIHFIIAFLAISWHIRQNAFYIFKI